MTVAAIPMNPPTNKLKTTLAPQTDTQSTANGFSMNLFSLS